ncbi:MAG: PASTA domain-containing protein, partial [Oscillospiraceae bacterium]|nr:PASTA domain-containing protein [Oscillospiraceae bacterium]
IPDIINMTSAEGKTTLRALGLSVRQESVSDENYETNRIVQVSPVVGSEIESGTTVTIYVNTLTMTGTVAVPDLTNLLLYEARTTLNSYGLQLGEITTVANSAASGTVVAQSIEPGTTVDSNTVIDVSVSEGVIYPEAFWVDNISLTVGDTANINVKKNPENAEGSFSYSFTGNYISISGSTITALAAGSTTVTVTCNETSATSTFTVTVSNAVSVSVTGVSLNESSAALPAGGTLQLTATVAPDNATNKSVTWTSDNSAAATVSDSGLVTAVAEGRAIITVTTSDGNYRAACEVTVSAAS